MSWRCSAICRVCTLRLSFVRSMPSGVNPRREYVPSATQGVELSGNTQFVALDGTRTFAVQMREAFIPDGCVLADPSDVFIKRIRAGFVLLQAGMGVGLIRGCISLMNNVKGQLGHVNKYLDVQPGHLAEDLGTIEAGVERLAGTPFESDPA